MKKIKTLIVISERFKHPKKMRAAPLESCWYPLSLNFKFGALNGNCASHGCHKTLEQNRPKYTCRHNMYDRVKHNYTISYDVR